MNVDPAVNYSQNALIHVMGQGLRVVLVKLYKAFIRPKIDYGCMEQAKIDSIQHKFI